MTQFKHGDRVTCKIYGEQITDARISIDSDGSIFVCQNVYDGVYAQDKLGYKYSFYTSSVNNILILYSDLRLAEKTWDTLEVGDEVRNEDGSRKVLGICGRVIFLSSYSNKNATGGYYNKEELIRLGYTIVNSTEEVTELTMEEVKKKFKITGKVLIKE